MIQDYNIQRINDLLSVDLSDLLKESKIAGYRFLERLVNDYKEGSNTFSKRGEGLFGVYDKQGLLIAIGGLNKDPYSNEPTIGRLRRFYVSSQMRRHGIGTFLLNGIIVEAKKYFKVLVLHTDTQEADGFYTAFGFNKDLRYPNSTHYLTL